MSFYDYKYETKVSKATIHFWKSKYNLKDQISNLNYSQRKQSNICGVVAFYVYKNELFIYS